MTVTPGKRLPAGPWRATVKLTSGLTSRKASATVLFSRHHSAPLSPAAMIWSGSGLALALLAALSYLARRRGPAHATATFMPRFGTRMP
jgi:hypothetical protein